MKIPRFVVNLETNRTSVVLRSTIPHPLHGEQHTTEDTLELENNDWLPADAIARLQAQAKRELAALLEQKKKTDAAKAGDALPSLE